MGHRIFMFLQCLSLERALVRTEQKQNLFWLLWYLWLSLNAVLQTTSFFLDWFWCRLFLFLVQIFSQCLSTVYFWVHICVLFHEVSPFFEAFFSGAWYQLPVILIYQDLSFVTWCFARVLTSFCTAFKPWSLTQ